MSEATDGGPLPDWIAQQKVRSAIEMGRAVSATTRVKLRPDFAERIVPKRGSVLASTQLANWDPDPDYFFHWLRDSALVMSAAALLVRHGGPASPWTRRFADFVRFSSALTQLDGRLAAQERDETKVAAKVRQFLRPAEELAALRGAALNGEVRFNPDGTLDRQKWARPQYDGLALRVLALLEHLKLAQRLAPPPYGQATLEAAQHLLDHDLKALLLHRREAGYDLWEERRGRHYYTSAVQRGALLAGAAWADAQGRSALAEVYAEAAADRGQQLDAFWQPARRIYRAHADRLAESDPAHGRGSDLDMAVILGILHAGSAEGPHTVCDPRAQATLERLESFFRKTLPLNRRGAVRQDSTTGLVTGRYPGDRYAGGGAWYITSFAVAEFHYRLAGAALSGRALPITDENRGFVSALMAASPLADLGSCQVLPPSARAALATRALAKGDATLDLLRSTISSDGRLSEQIDATSGRQVSAKDLAWSHAAFLTAANARAKVEA